MAVWVGIGTGSLLWLSAAYALLRAARIVRTPSPSSF
jgi:hypothetical protein